MTSDRSTVILIHGAWHGAWCWGMVTRELSRAGHRALAIDMQGHGAEALVPRAFEARPFDAQAFATEVSPLAAVSIESAAGQLVRQIEAVRSSEPVVLVAHSMSGPVAGAAAERAPHLIDALVYVAALMPPPGQSAATFGMSEANAASLIRPLVVADPDLVRTLRIDPRNPDPGYRRALQAAFYADVPESVAVGATRLLTCDDPSGIVAGTLALSRGRWGAVPRSYIICEDDMAIRPAVQEAMIGAVDDAVGGDPTRVFRLPSSHSPFLSMPGRLAEVIQAAARP